jgi:hypothetical protein
MRVSRSDHQPSIVIRCSSNLSSFRAFIRKSRLVICVDIMDAYLSPLDVFPEVMSPYIQVFCSGSIFVNLCHVKCSAVVLEYAAVCLSFGSSNRVSQSLESFLQEFHYRYRITQCIAQPSVFAFS